MKSPVVLGLLVLVACIGAGATELQSPDRRVIRITAERFSFTPSEIVLDVGEKVELRITSDDTAHGFRIIGTGVNLVVPKRGKGTTTADFDATEAGRYTFECTRMCGAGHNFMRGELIVRPRAVGSATR